MKYTHSLFIFRRDLRTQDNIGLITALQQSENVIACFIFDPRQCTGKNNYKSANALQFMIESLQELNTLFEKKGKKLYIFYGKPENILKKLLKVIPIKAVFANRDYTPFSRQRDETLEKICKKQRVDIYFIDDGLLIGSPDAIKTKKNTPIKLFTPFYKKALTLPLSQPRKLRFKNFYNKSIQISTIDITKELTSAGVILKTVNSNLFAHGGRSRGLRLIKKIKTMQDYKNTKDFPALPTTYLSAHHKFGTVSIRETAHEIIRCFGRDHELLRQLYWRDFFTYLIWHFPELLGEQCRKVSWQWSHDKKKFAVWCTGKTGFPFIDTGMQMLNKTGFMPNRMRMVAASYLTKTLKIDWHWGERYFAQKLVDYDPAVNNGNWQWVASTGCDAQPPFRKFSPDRQYKKFGGLQKKYLA